MWSPLGKPDVFPYPQPGEHNNACEVLLLLDKEGSVVQITFNYLKTKQTKEKQQPQNKSTQELKNPHLMKVNR